MQSPSGFEDPRSLRGGFGSPRHEALTLERRSAAATPPSTRPTRPDSMLHPTKSAALGAALLALAPLARPHANVPPAPRPQEAAQAPAALEEPQLAPGDARKLQKAFSDYFGANRARKSDLEARADIEKLIGEFERKDRQKRAFLSLMADLEQAMLGAMPHTDSDVKAKGRVVKESFTEQIGGQITYALHVPAKYSAKNLYPLVVSIPDQGEDVETHLKEWWASAPVREQAVLVAVGMPADVSLWNEVTRLDPTTSERVGGGGAVILHVLRETMAKARIDPNRIYIAGKGRGVEAALAVARSFPDRFAAVVGRSGDAGEITPANFRNLPTFFAGGGEKATAFAAAAKEAGHENSQVVPDADEAAVWQWLSAQRRQANPATVVFKPATDASSKCFWVELLAIADVAKDQPRVEATADRATNTITLSCANVPRVRLMLNDRLVDLSKPVRIVVNGVEHETHLQRDFMRMLDAVSRTGDWGRVYTAATRDLDVPAARPE